jgi:hypothetical protein
MANQMIALQARNPQLPDPSRQTAQFANMINMARQAEAAQLQGARTRQEMEFARAEEARRAELQTPNVAKARSEADSARLKYVMDYFDTSVLALTKVRDPQQAMAVGNRIKALFPEPELQASIDETLASIPQDPAQFEAWREDSLFRTMEAKDQLAQEFTTQNLGTSTRVIRAPKYGRGGAEVVEGSQAAVDIKPTVVNTDELGPIIVDPNTGRGYPVSAGAIGAYTAPGVGGSRGVAGAGTEDVVFGFGRFGSPSKPLSTLSIGEVQDFQRNTLIPNTRGKVGAGPDKGTGAVGTYQITYGTLQDYAPKVLGSNWRNTPFTADVQERIAKAIYDDVKGGNLKDTWAGLPNNRPGAYKNVPWEQVRDQIIQVESAGGPRGGGGGTPTGAGAPQTIRQVASAADRARTVKSFKDITGFDFTSGKDPVADLIKRSTSGGAEKLGADIVGFIPESMGGGATKGMEAIGALEVIASDLTLALLPGNKLGAGVSNEDRKMFEKLVGEMQNPSIPAGKRLTAWGQLKAKMARIAGIPEPKTSTSAAAGSQRAAKTSTIPTLTPEQVRANPKIKRWRRTDGRIMTRP